MKFKVLTLLGIIIASVKGERSFLFLCPGEGTDKPEVLSLPLGNSSSCDGTIDTYPDRPGGGVSFLVGGLITVCGGNGMYGGRCLSLDPLFGIWEEIIKPLPYNVVSGSSTTLANGDPIVLGGCDDVDQDNPPPCSSIIFHQDTGEWIPGPALPFPHLYGMCTIKLNTTHTLMLGGTFYTFGKEPDYGTLSNLVYLFDGETFQQMANMSNPREECGCALNSDGDVVVAGGMGDPRESEDPDGDPMDSVEIYNIQANTWTKGPSLPAPRGFTGMATDGDKVLLIGGLEEGGIDLSRDIFSLKTGAAEWEVEETRLAYPSGDGPKPLKFLAENFNC